MPVQHTSFGPYVTGRDPDGKHWGGFLFGVDVSRPSGAEVVASRETARHLDAVLVEDAHAEHGMPRVIALLEEIRDRLTGVRPTIHVPTAAECERFGGKGVR